MERGGAANKVCQRMGLKIVPESPDLTVTLMDEGTLNNMHKSGVGGICPVQNLCINEVSLVPQSKVY